MLEKYKATDGDRTHDLPLQADKAIPLLCSTNWATEALRWSPWFSCIYPTLCSVVYFYSVHAPITCLDLLNTSSELIMTHSLDRLIWRLTLQVYRTSLFSDFYFYGTSLSLRKLFEAFYCFLEIINYVDQHGLLIILNYRSNYVGKIQGHRWGSNSRPATPGR